MLVNCCRLYFSSPFYSYFLQNPHKNNNVNKNDKFIMSSRIREMRAEKICQKHFGKHIGRVVTGLADWKKMKCNYLLVPMGELIEVKVDIST